MSNISKGLDKVLGIPEIDFRKYDMLSGLLNNAEMGAAIRFVEVLPKEAFDALDKAVQVRKAAGEPK